MNANYYIDQIADVVGNIVDKVQKAPTNAYDVQIAKINAISGTIAGLALMGMTCGFIYALYKAADNESKL